MTIISLRTAGAFTGTISVDREAGIIKNVLVISPDVLAGPGGSSGGTNAPSGRQSVGDAFGAPRSEI